MKYLVDEKTHAEFIRYWINWMNNPEHRGRSWIEVAGLLLQEPAYKAAHDDAKEEIRFLAIGKLRAV